jgi:hypothetical protein
MASTGAQGSHQRQRIRRMANCIGCVLHRLLLLLHQSQTPTAVHSSLMLLPLLLLLLLL